MRSIFNFLAVISLLIFVACNSNSTVKSGADVSERDTIKTKEIVNEISIDEELVEEQIELPVKADTVKQLSFLQLDSIQYKIQLFNEFDDGEMRIFSQKDHYICYETNEGLKLQMLFNENDEALLAKYKKNTYGLELVYLGEEFLKGAAYPTIHKYYAELVKGKFNGTYKLTKSGNYEYAKYTSLEGKVFEFTGISGKTRTKDECL